MALLGEELQPFGFWGPAGCGAGCCLCLTGPERQSSSLCLGQQLVLEPFQGLSSGQERGEEGGSGKQE